MKDDLDYWQECLRKIHYIHDNAHIKLLYELVDEIKKANLSKTEILDLLRNIDAEVASDILTVLLKEKFLSEYDFEFIDDCLKTIYEEEYLRDKENGDFELRLALKKSKNIRPISRHEIVTIFFKNTENAKLLWGIEKTDDEFLLTLIGDFKKIKENKKSSRIYKLQKDNMETVLNSLINDVKNSTREVK